MNILLLMVAIYSVVRAEVLYERFRTTRAPSPACEQYYEKVKKEFICCKQLIEPIDNSPTWWFPGLPELPSDKKSNKDIMEFSIKFCGHLLQEHLCTQKMVERIEVLPDSCRDDTILQNLKSKEAIPIARMHYLCDKNATNLKEFYKTGAVNCLRRNNNHSIVSQTSMCVVFTYDFDFIGEKFPPNCQRFKSLVNCLEEDWKEPCGSTGAGLLKGSLRAVYESIHCREYQKKPWLRPKSTRSGSKPTRANDRTIFSLLIWLLPVYKMLT